MQLEAFRDFGTYRWTNKMVLDAFEGYTAMLDSGTENPLIIQRAKEACYILDLALKSTGKNTGCIPSSIAFTHGANVFGEINLKVWQNETSRMYDACEQIEKVSRQWVFRTQESQLTPNKLGRIVNLNKCSWVICMVDKNLAHALSFTKDIKSEKIWVWDTARDMIMPSLGIFVPLRILGVNELYSLIKTYHNSKVEGPLRIISFADRVRGR